MHPEQASRAKYGMYYLALQSYVASQRPYFFSQCTYAYVSRKVGLLRPQKVLFRGARAKVKHPELETMCQVLEYFTALYILVPVVVQLSVQTLTTLQLCTEIIRRR